VKRSFGAARTISEGNGIAEAFTEEGSKVDRYSN